LVSAQRTLGRTTSGPPIQVSLTPKTGLLRQRFRIRDF
jgi:hypothetical protein